MSRNDYNHHKVCQRHYTHSASRANVENLVPVWYKQKASFFEKKLSGMLPILSATQAKIKLDMILQNMQHYSKLSRINKHSLKVLVDKLMHDFC